MHSPFVFDFIRNVLNDGHQYAEYEKVESLRKKLLQDTTILKVEDMGAGSAISSRSNRTIASIARSAAKPKKFGQLLFRIARHYTCNNIIELGTSLGITSSYLSLSHSNAHVVTMEGAPTVAEVAERNFRQLGIGSIQMVKGNFDNTLNDVLRRMPEPDLVFIDGNHRMEPTLRYFNQIIENCKSDSIVIFDDIHWSRGMEKAWQTVKDDDRVKCTIDLFFIGIVLFRKEFKEKQHFSIRF